MSNLQQSKSVWVLASAMALALICSVLVGTGVYGGESRVELLTEEEMGEIRGQGICAQCSTTAGTACPPTGNPCATITCTLHAILAGDGIRWCSGSNYTCTTAGLRKGCSASWSFWCNASSTGVPCGFKRSGSCYLGLFGCNCSSTLFGACPKSDCT